MLGACILIIDFVAQIVHCLGLLSFDHWQRDVGRLHPYHWFCWYILSILLFYKVVVYGCTHQDSHSLGGGVYLIGDEFRAGFFYFRSNVHRATHCRSLCALPVRGHPLSIRLFNLIVDVSPKTFQEFVLKLGPPTWERKGSLHVPVWSVRPTEPNFMSFRLHRRLASRTPNATWRWSHPLSI